jgi:hypothetical protein
MNARSVFGDENARRGSAIVKLSDWTSQWDSVANISRMDNQLATKLPRSEVARSPVFDMENRVGTVSGAPRFRNPSKKRW